MQPASSPAVGSRRRAVLLRRAAPVLGIVGGLAGLGWAVLALFIALLAAGIATDGGDSALVDAVARPGLPAIVLSLVGLIGGAVALVRPRTGRWVLLFAAIGSALCLTLVWRAFAVMASDGPGSDTFLLICSELGPLLMLASVLALWRSRPRVP
jgi:hypothetical protein